MFPFSPSQPRDPGTLTDERSNGWILSLNGIKRFRLHRRPRWLKIGGIVLLLLSLVAIELNTSWMQALVLSRLAASMTYQMAPGRAPDVAFPTHGPYDERLGYTALPAWLDSLETRGFVVVAQARPSSTFRAAAGLGLYPAYPRKSQAGLRLLDRAHEELFRTRYPGRVYAAPDSIPELVWRTLLYIENRDLLEEGAPYKNPAIEWDRFAGAFARRLVHGDGPGGSTLATQLTKVRHSPDGLTSSAAEKLRQMMSASLQAYLPGARTDHTRWQIVSDYLNSLPLAASPGHGEVNGLGDGLWVWFGTDFEAVNHLLRADTTSPLSAQAVAYRQVLSLLLSTRSPTRYLVRPEGPDALRLLTDQYLRLLARDGLISTSLRDAALQSKLTVLSRAPSSPPPPFTARKAASALRMDLLSLLDAPSLTALDRYDLDVYTPFAGDVQRDVVRVLEHLHDPEYLREQGLAGTRLLATGDPSAVTYSVVLYERGPQANVLRVQADNFPGPFDVNRGSKLELGSTAKLRTLITYLEIVEETYDRYRERPMDELRDLPVAASDPITQWTVDQLLRDSTLTREALLTGAMSRTYSAHPGERFFTGGGAHVFHNFSPETTGRMTVHTALRHSVNLVFIRMMRDIVNYQVAQLPGQPGSVLDTPTDERRAEYLRRFADQEGRVFLSRYYRTYRDAGPERSLETFGVQHVMNARRLAWAYRSVIPEAGPTAFGAYLRRHAADAETLTEPRVAELFAMARRAETLSWQDRGYLAGVHPLELWLVHFLYTYPDASVEPAAEASREIRQEVYSWLFRKGKASQDLRIRTMLEQEAFARIHQRWRRLGYPFDRLVPSYATAIGSSADRPAALAELMGILVRDGRRYPMVRLDTLHFASGTPYETVVSRRPVPPTRVLSPELCQVVRLALLDAVERGTAVRAQGAVLGPDGTRLPIGGKTGTGDNRLRSAGGDLALNRTSTFVFFIGDRFFGTIVAYVPGTRADSFTFTSSLVTAVLKIVGPSLSPLLSADDVRAADLAWTTYHRTRPVEAPAPPSPRPVEERPPLPPDSTRTAPLPADSLDPTESDTTQGQP